MFENKTTYGKEAVWALSRVFTWKVRNLRRKGFFISMGLLGMACGLLLALIFDTLDFGGKCICVMTLAICVPALLMGLFLRRFTAWSTMRLLRKTDASLDRFLSFSEESFHGAQSGMETTYQYETVRGAYETEGHFVLQLDAQRYMVVDKSGFTLGTADTFRAFLDGSWGSLWRR